MGIKRGDFEKLKPSLDSKAQRIDPIAASIPMISGIGTPLRIAAKGVLAEQKADAILYKGVADGIHKICNGISMAFAAYDSFSSAAGSAQQSLDAYKSSVESGAEAFDQTKYNGLVRNVDTAKANTGWFASVTKAWTGYSETENTLDTPTINSMFSGWGASAAKGAFIKNAEVQAEVKSELAEANSSDDDDDKYLYYKGEF